MQIEPQIGYAVVVKAKIKTKLVMAGNQGDTDGFVIEAVNYPEDYTKNKYEIGDYVAAMPRDYAFIDGPTREEGKCVMSVNDLIGKVIL